MSQSESFQWLEMPEDNIHFDISADAALLLQAGLDARAVFSDPRIRVWRKLADRENSVFESEGVKWHIKRYPNGQMAIQEVQGISLLKDNGIDTVSLTAWGVLSDRRGFVISRDLEGYLAGDQLVRQGGDPKLFLEPSAQVAAKLHSAGLHHRDLYLNHFFLKTTQTPVHCVLIDPARVKRLPWLFKKRWVVKDLAQFGYSLQKVRLPSDFFDQWLGLYERFGGFPISIMRSAIDRKIRWIAKHDSKLNKQQPTRNVTFN
jgi:hypothetical protein